MIDLVRKFFGKGGHTKTQNAKIGPHDLRVAACALFLEMAAIDGEFSEEERERIVSVLTSDYGLSSEYAAALLESSERELKGSIDLWQFTSLINQNYSLDEKLQIIELLWKVVYADGCLDKHEDYLVHKLANLLRLSHQQLIDAKMKVLGWLGAMSEKSRKG